VKIHRDLAARSHGDQDVKIGLATALYVQALLEPRSRDKLLQEPATLIDSTPAEFRKLY
jgi:hypothetical protein